MSIDGKSDVSPVTPKRKAVIAKIRALMAKTVENGATEAEAKAASAKIHKLMSAYAIELTDTAIEVTYTGDGDVERPRRRRAASNPWSPDDRIVLEEERRQLTGYSRGWWFQLERQGKVPRRVKLGERKVGWLYSEIRAWQRQRAALRVLGGDDASAA